MKIAKIPGSVWAGLCALLLYQALAWGRNSPYNAHILLAQAWLQGRVTPATLGGWLEHVQMPVGAIIPYGPAPAVLMLPWVAIWQERTNQATICAALGSVNVALIWHLTYLMQRPRNWQIFWTLLFAVATPHLFYSAYSGNTWPLMHIVTILGGLIALVDIFGSGRGWLAGLGMGFAYGTRQSALLMVPFILGMLLSGGVPWLGIRGLWQSQSMSRWEDRKSAFLLLLGSIPWQRGLSFLIGLASCMGMVWLYNWLRFQDPWETGFNQVVVANIGVEYRPYGLLSPGYILKNLRVYFTTLPDRIPDFPWWRPSSLSLNLWMMNPVLLGLPATPWLAPKMLWCWGLILTQMGFYMLYYWDGTSQFGMRYTLDWLPFAWLILVTAQPRLPRWAWGILFGLGLAVEIWAFSTSKIANLNI